MTRELTDSVMLILGIKTNHISVALISVIIGTIVLLHGAKGWLFTNEGVAGGFLSL